MAELPVEDYSGEETGSTESESVIETPKPRGAVAEPSYILRYPIDLGPIPWDENIVYRPRSPGSTVESQSELEDVSMSDIAAPPTFFNASYETPEDETARMRAQGAAIDAAMAEARGEEEEAALRQRNGYFKPNITPDDADWISVYEDFKRALQKKPVGTVMAEKFDDAQVLLLQPPMKNNTILNLQKANAEEYKRNLAGRFGGVKDNIITKMTMMWFGLPVEAITYNNVIRASLDESDPEDSPLDIPRVQRIMFAEKPLEFLDTYWERGYGFHRLHRKKPQTMLEPANTSPAQRSPVSARQRHLFTTPDGKPRPVPTMPIRPVSLRGGAGPHVIPKHIYSRYGGMLYATEEGTFKKNALRLLDLDEASEWEFVVDVYGNKTSRDDKKESKHEDSFLVTKSNFSEIYNDQLDQLVDDPDDDWVIVVDYPKQVEYAPPTFTSPQVTRPFEGNPPGPTLKSARKRVGPPAPVNTSRSPQEKAFGPSPKSAKQVKFPPNPVSPTTSRSRDMSKNSPSRKTPTKQVLALIQGPNGKMDNPTDSAKDFCTKALGLIDLSFDQANWAFVVHLENHEKKELAVKYVISKETFEKDYQNYIRDLLFDNQWEIKIDRVPVEEDVNKDNHQDDPEDLPDYEESDEYEDYSPPPPRSPVPSPTVQKKQTPPKRNIFKSAINTISSLASKLSPIKTSSEKVSQTPKSQGYIYGYAGKALAEPTAKSFQDATLKLLGLDAAEDNRWTFQADIYSISSRKFTDEIDLDDSNFKTVFQHRISPLIKGADTWPIFVRTGPRHPGHTNLEPNPQAKNIISIKSTRGTSWWKIPNQKRLAENYGINQIQESFFRAMQVHFPASEPRPAGRVFLGTFHLGFGGMKATPELWEFVQQNAQKEKLILELRVNPHPFGDNIIGIRMTGNERLGGFSLGDFRKLHEEIGRITEDSSAYGKIPKQFTLWKKAEDWEKNGQSASSNEYSQTPENVETLKQKFGTLRGETNCVWFRPDWDDFEIYDLVDKEEPSQLWKAGKDRTLSSFRRALGHLYPNSRPQLPGNFFIIMDPNGEKGTRYVITKHTTEDEWRKHVFDHFSCSGPNLYVKMNVGVEYVLDESDGFGLLEKKLPPLSPLISRRPAWTTPGISPIATKTTFSSAWPPKPSTFPSDMQDPSRRELFDLSGLRDPTPRLNKERLLKPQAERHIVEKYETWTVKNNTQDALQLKSWSRDQPVIVPGRKPEAPIFGPSREPLLSISSNMPTIYTHFSTPTDIATLRSQSEEYRNQALDRITKCFFCDKTFPVYQKGEVEAHFGHHKVILEQDPVCPLCEDTRWVLMPLEEKKVHLLNHQAREESEKMRNFWNHITCPICGTDFRGYPQTDILLHMAEHPAGLICFCDRCGGNLTIYEKAEKDHHRRVCKGGTTNPKYCGKCGQNRASQTYAEFSEHYANCNGKGNFHEKCGFNLNLLDKTLRPGHELRCHRPVGVSDTYCRLCGRNWTSFSEEERRLHLQECSKEKAKQNTKEEKAKRLERVVQTIEAQGLKNSEEFARLQTRQKELKDQEAALRQREERIAQRESENSDEIQSFQNARHRASQNSQNSRPGESPGEPGSGLFQSAARRFGSNFGGPALDICPVCPEDLSNFNKHQIVSHYADNMGPDCREEHKGIWETRKEVPANNRPCRCPQNHAPGQARVNLKDYPGLKDFMEHESELDRFVREEGGEEDEGEISTGFSRLPGRLAFDPYKVGGNVDGEDGGEDVGAGFVMRVTRSMNGSEPGSRKRGRPGKASEVEVQSPKKKTRRK